MKKTISNNSSGIQADGDVNVNIGLTFDQVEKLTTLFLQQNFPKLRDDAMKTANENVQFFLNEFENRLKNEFTQIDANKFADPDVQYSINEAVIETAKRGNKSNFDVLADLVVKRAYADQSDLQSLAISHAIKIVSRLTRHQINLLCVEYLIAHMSIPNLIHLNNYENSCALLNELTEGLETLTGWNLQYLASQSCIEIHFITGMKDVVKIMQEKYPEILSSLKPEEIREQINSTRYFKRFIEIYEKQNLTDVSLTITGQLIAAIKIAHFLPKSIDFKNYIK